MVVATRKLPIRVPKEDKKEKAKEKTKVNRNGPRYQDLTISGHDLPHPEVREGHAALSKEEKGSDQMGLGFRKSSLEGSLVGSYE